MNMIDVSQYQPGLVIDGAVPRDGVSRCERLLDEFGGWLDTEKVTEWLNELTTLTKMRRD